MPSTVFQSERAHPELWNSEEFCSRFSHYIGKHVVGLFVAYEFQNKPHKALLSGFLYRHNGIPLWITAGHSLEKIKKIRDNPQIKVIRASWIDRQSPMGTTIARNPEDSATEIPIGQDLNGLAMFSIFERGVDCGLILLSGNTFDLMNANDDNLFFDERVLNRARHTTGPECFFLIGFPKELHNTTEERIGTRLEFSLSAPMLVLPVVPIGDEESRCEPEPFWEWKDAFYARLVPFYGQRDLPLDDIDMMSGGPIISLRRTADGQLRYFLRAIQSSWVAKRRLIRGTPVEAMGFIIEWITKKCQESRESQDMISSVEQT